MKTSKIIINQNMINIKMKMKIKQIKILTKILIQILQKNKII